MRKFKNTIFIISLVSIIFIVTSFIIQTNIKKEKNISLGKKDLSKVILLDFNNKPIKALDLLKNPSVIFFGFTNCPDICPLTLTKLSITLQKIKDNKNLIIYFVSLDPERDKPEILKNYLQPFKEQVVGLTGSQYNLKKFADYLKIKYYKRKIKDGYTIDHTSSSILMSEGKIFDKILFDDDLKVSIKKINNFLSHIK